MVLTEIRIEALKMPNDTRLLQLVHALYESALDKNSWPSFLELLRHEVGGSAACLLYHDAADHRGGVEAAVGLDPAALLAYSQHYAALDPWARALAARRLLKSGLVCTLNPSWRRRVCATPSSTMNTFYGRVDGRLILRAECRSGGASTAGGSVLKLDENMVDGGT